MPCCRTLMPCCRTLIICTKATSNITIVTRQARIDASTMVAAAAWTNIREMMETNICSMGKESPSLLASLADHPWYIWAKVMPSYFARRRASRPSTATYCMVRVISLTMAIFVCRCVTGEITMMMIWTNDYERKRGRVLIWLIRNREATKQMLVEKNNNVNSYTTFIYTCI